MTCIFKPDSCAKAMTIVHYWAEDLRKCPNPKSWRQLKSAIVIERTSEKEKAERSPLRWRSLEPHPNKVGCNIGPRTSGSARTRSRGGNWSQRSLKLHENDHQVAHTSRKGTVTIYCAIVIERTSEKEKAERNPLKSKGRMIILIYIKKIIKVR